MKEAKCGEENTKDELPAGMTIFVPKARVCVSLCILAPLSWEVTGFNSMSSFLCLEKCHGIFVDMNIFRQKPCIFCVLVFSSLCSVLIPSLLVSISWISSLLRSITFFRQKPRIFVFLFPHPSVLEWRLVFTSCPSFCVHNRVIWSLLTCVHLFLDSSLISLVSLSLLISPSLLAGWPLLHVFLLLFINVSCDLRWHVYFLGEQKPRLSWCLSLSSSLSPGVMVEAFCMTYATDSFKWRKDLLTGAVDGE